MKKHEKLPSMQGVHEGWVMGQKTSFGLKKRKPQLRFGQSTVWAIPK